MLVFKHRFPGGARWCNVLGLLATMPSYPAACRYGEARRLQSGALPERLESQATADGASALAVFREAMVGTWKVCAGEEFVLEAGWGVTFFEARVSHSSEPRVVLHFPPPYFDMGAVLALEPEASTDKGEDVESCWKAWCHFSVLQRRLRLIFCLQTGLERMRVLVATSLGAPPADDRLSAAFASLELSGQHEARPAETRIMDSLAEAFGAMAFGGSERVPSLPVYRRVGELLKVSSP
mmetsp:Transcript_47663/g.137202  ORF Transcript_47663/g.137202 Transcript_47663/m.137202 type:complete len:238 (+) Transcript_47663:61-774(+)